MVSVETLLYIIKDGKVLLIYKKRGLGKGLYNGVGGKVEEGETPEKAAVRECEEEVGVTPLGVEWMGVLEFFKGRELYGYVNVFVASDYRGELRETDEARPEWFDLGSVPYDSMWEDDRHWLPHVLSGRKIYGRFWFTENWEKMTRWELYFLERGGGGQQWQT